MTRRDWIAFILGSLAGLYVWSRLVIYAFPITYEPERTVTVGGSRGFRIDLPSTPWT